MKKLIPVMAVSFLALAACQTSDTADKKDMTVDNKAKAECTDPNDPNCGSTGGGPATSGPITDSTDGAVDCDPTDPDNPQCGTGGPATGGPITMSSDEAVDCDPNDPDNPQCGTGGPATGGPITDD